MLVDDRSIPGMTIAERRDSEANILKENGPCQFYNNASTPSLNPYSWNEYAK